MLLLTTDAAEAIKELVDAPDAEGLRISAVPASVDSAGLGLELTLAPGPAPEDAVIEAEDAHVYLDPPAARALDDKVLDADLEAGELHFTVREQ
jgi:iron-sulfur cluster assembly protein